MYNLGFAAVLHNSGNLPQVACSRQIQDQIACQFFERQVKVAERVRLHGFQIEHVGIPVGWA